MKCINKRHCNVMVESYAEPIICKIEHCKMLAQTTYVAPFPCVTPFEDCILSLEASKTHN
jgi:hypothetical protein